MRRTEAFLIAAIAGIVVFIFTSDLTPWPVTWFVIHICRALGISATDGSNQPFPEVIDTAHLITATVVSAGITLILGVTESLASDISVSKYSVALSNLMKETARIAAGIDISRTDTNYWEAEIKAILEAVWRSFLSSGNEQEMRGGKFSACIMKPESQKLKIIYYESSDELFEPDAPEQRFSKNEGFCGHAWSTKYPQSGRKKKWIRKDERYAIKGGTNNQPRSFVAIPIVRDRDNDDKTIILSISSDNEDDFHWQKRHATMLYHGIKPTSTLIKMVLEKCGL
jgi:hypothetical protein